MAAALNILAISRSELKFSMERSCICRTVITVCSSQNKPVQIYCPRPEERIWEERSSEASAVLSCPIPTTGNANVTCVCRRAGLSCPGSPLYNDRVLNSLRGTNSVSSYLCPAGQVHHSIAGREDPAQYHH